jgi:heavy metal translocating P-type ATPase
LARRRRDALRDSILRLGAAFDTCERVTCCGSSETVPVDEIAPGDTILVAAGNGIPVDGTVAEGVSLVSEAALTGEPYPVVKRAGDAVMAGSRAEDGVLRITASSRGRSRRLDALLRAVEDARRSPGRIQRQADRLVAWFLPAVMLIAAITTAAWTWHSGWVVGVFNGLAVLLVACPCSMGLATPVAVWSALAALARRGLFARHGDAIEQLASVNIAVFDKTGTLSESEARMVDFVAEPEQFRSPLLAEVAAIQAGSGHPIARAFRGTAAPSTPVLARDIRVLPGAGVEGTLPDGTRLQIGNAAILGANEDASTLRGRLVAGAGGGNEIFVVRNGRLCGLAVLRESLRESAPAAMVDLAAMGLRTIVMTGDRAENAARFGFDECLAGLTPDAKRGEVSRLEAAGGHVLFLGDGINDAPAMAAATTSIALASGSELPRETAAMELGGQDLRAVPQAVAISRATVHAIRRNLVFAACYNVAGIGLAAAGLLHPIAAALIMLVSSMTVTWRVLRETSDAVLEKSAAHPGTMQDTPPAAPRGARLEGALLAAALAAQGPFIAWLGGFHGTAAAGFILLFLAAAAAVFLLSRHRTFSAPARMTLTMFAAGGLAMLTGWWADAGFAAVVRDGVCLCGCAQSDMGLGLLGRLSWMDAGMLLAALPGLFLDRPATAGAGSRVWCWMAGLAGMFLGMELGASVLAGLPVVNASAQFFLTYAAMTVGMCLGMLGACAAVRRFA